MEAADRGYAAGEERAPGSRDERSRVRVLHSKRFGNACVRDLPVDDAIEHPRLHLEDDVVQIEGGWPEGTAEQLQRAGQQVNPWADRNLYFGGVSGVERRPDGTLAAAGDPRRGGHGIVVG